MAASGLAIRSPWRAVSGPGARMRGPWFAVDRRKAGATDKGGEM
jgi:hypothetical protein